MDEEKDKKKNVVYANFKEIEENDKEHLLATLADMDLDELLVIGLKGDDAFMAHTNFESRMKLMGAIEGMKMWLWVQGYFTGPEE